MNNAYYELLLLKDISYTFLAMENDNREMMKKLLVIALPIMLQNLISTSLTFADTLMIGQLGQNELAAVGITTQVYFLISLFFFGISSGTSIFLSQYYGSGEHDKMRRTMAFGFSICLIGALLMALFSFFFPEAILMCFTKDPSVIAYGVSYLKIVAPSYLFAAVSAVLSIGFRAESKANIPMLISVYSLTQNAIGNYLLIFGIGPFPEMGVAGGALSTTLARIVEMLLLIYLTYRRGGECFAFRRGNDFKWDKAFLLSFTSTSLPVLFNEVFWALGMTLYKVAFALLGTEALATFNIVDSIDNLFFIAVLGIGNGATILLGNTLGAGDKEKAIRWARKLMLISFFIGLIMGLAEFALSPFFTTWFSVSDSVRTTSILSLKARGVSQPFRAIATLTVIGILRAGGDTKFAAISEMAGVYLVGVPIAFIGATVLKLPLELIYLALVFEEIAKIIFSFPRIVSKKWAHVLTDKA